MRETPELMIAIDERIRSSLAVDPVEGDAEEVDPASVVDPDDLPISLG